MIQSIPSIPPLPLSIRHVRCSVSRHSPIRVVRCPRHRIPPPARWPPRRRRRARSRQLRRQRRRSRHIPLCRHDIWRGGRRPPWPGRSDGCRSVRDGLTPSHSPQLGAAFLAARLRAETQPRHRGVAQRLRRGHCRTRPPLTVAHDSGCARSSSIENDQRWETGAHLAGRPAHYQLVRPLRCRPHPDPRMVRRSVIGPRSRAALRVPL